jgi:nicotinate-nucleotide adenylyltransferase
VSKASAAPTGPAEEAARIVEGRLGVLGGAFNPPHIGHLVLAQEASWQLELDSVMLVPTGHAAHKEIEDDPGADVRMDMTRVAIEDDERLSVSDAEVRRPGPSYTYETLELLADAHPDTELVLLMGADVAMGLGEWERPERVLELARLGVARRAGLADELIEQSIGEAGGKGAPSWIAMPALEVSSSGVRERVRERKPIRYLVPGPVADLIASRGLYA